MKPNLNLFITRTQIYRNFIASDGCQFLSDLAVNFQVNLVVTNNLEQLVRKKLENSKIDLNLITVYVLPANINITQLQKVLLSLMKFSTKSSSNLYLAYNSLTKSKHKRIFLVALSQILPKIPFIISLLRSALRYSVARCDELASNFELIPKCDLAFFTSFTDFKPEGVLGIYYTILGIRTIGTPRSWDNITSHGVIPWVPSLVISHSPFMTKNLKNSQNIGVEKIIEANAPNYRSMFLQKEKVSSSEIRIGFACMGFTTNPDDFNMLKWFTTELAANFKNLRFYIYQHPKFKHSIEFNLLPNVQIRVFDYESSTLQEYYSEISSLKVLFAGGTSVLLDAVYCSVPTYFLNFDCAKQSYWHSALRYRDVLPHTAQFLETCRVSKVDSKSELEKLLLEISNFDMSFGEYQNMHQFTGNEKVSYSQIIYAELEKLKS
jgi:hypothetical protein